MSNKAEKNGPHDKRVDHLQAEVAYRVQLQEIGNRIHSASNLDEILVDLTEEILQLFDADRITLYAVDSRKQELFSLFKSGTEIDRIRVPISSGSIAGFCASRNQSVCIQDVYDDRELAAIDPSLRFDRRWDQDSGYITRQVLTSPITHQQYLLGVIQLLNRQKGGHFTAKDELSVREIGKILGIAFFNHRRKNDHRQSRYDYLLENGYITKDELKKAVLEARENGGQVDSQLLQHYQIPKEAIGRSLSQFFKVPFEPLESGIPVPEQLLSLVKPTFLRHHVWVPLRNDSGRIDVAIDNPADLQKTNEIQAIFKKIGEVRFHVAMHEDIFRLIDVFMKAEKKTAGIEDILSKLQADKTETVETDAAMGGEDSAVVQLVNKIILDAIDLKASDIHIEPYPGKENTLVRFRIDGSCRHYQSIPYHYRNAVVSRIKIMSDLDISERRKPQDGKIRFNKFGGRDIEIRVATLPTQGDMEDVVLRLLKKDGPVALELMGFSEQNLENFIQAVTMPYGLVVVCGPTGSGKTTTLHSALGYINKADTKIWTVEDPVEISQRGLRQVQVKHKIGLDFASAMRAFLRADPDVIMVGEMRDKETAKICIEASLTGHLVFSTLHTNGAPESVARLLDLGMDPFNFSDAILCILAQRLVKKLCDQCKEAYHPSRDEFEELVREYGADEFGRYVGIPYSESLRLYRPAGCDACQKTGYRGRTGIHELLTGTGAIKEMIQHKARIEDLRDQAIRDGMRTLKQDGIEKIFTGSTNLIQVRRVCIK